MRKDGLQRREAVLDAALRCFVDRGVLATGIEDIRKAAGASPSSIYHLFGGLSGIVTALLIRTFDRVITHIVARVAAAATAREAVRALVDSHLEWVWDNQDDARFMYQAMGAELAGETRDAVLAAKAELKKPLIAAMARFADELPDWPWPAMEFVVLGPAHEACRRHFAGEEVDAGWLRAHLPELATRTLF